MDAIKSMSDLLDEVLKRNITTAEEYHQTNGTKHPVLLGDIYEGITADILKKTLFENLNLKVVTGQIRLHNGELSNQVDCMIVKNIGREMPFTGKFECDIDDVLAIIEVKKTLYKDELEDSLLKMQKITEGFDIEKTTAMIYEEDLYRGYEMLTGNYLDDITLYTGKNVAKNNYKSVLINTLIQDYALPLRIIFGYKGYSNEKTLREGYINIIENNSKIKSGPLMLPNLIICNRSSLIKTNGIPYGSRLEEKSEDRFTGMASYIDDPILILLEILWTKLCNVFRDELDSSIFGYELNYENIIPLLLYKFEEYKGNYGFIGEILNLKRINRKTLRYKDDGIGERIKISEVAQIVFLRLTSDGEISMLDKDFRQYCDKNEINLIDLKKELIGTGYVKIKRDKILLREKGMFLIDSGPDGDFIVKSKI